jgi:5-methylthioribose kinase
MLRVPSSSGPASRTYRRCFYQKIAVADTVQQIMPKLIDAINNMIALEDLGKTNDFTILYDEKENYKNRNSTN